MFDRHFATLASEIETNVLSTHPLDRHSSSALEDFEQGNF
jgi:hypothetical protein